MIDIFIVFALIYFFHSEIASFIIMHFQVREDYNCKDCNVIIVVIDAARQDHLGFYGYHRDTTPNIDRLAEKSFVFKNAISQATWTKPSIASLFTSLYPTRHGTYYFTATKEQGIINNVLPSSFITLAEALKHHNYKTYGLVNNQFIGPELNFDQGFDYYRLIESDEDLTRTAIDIIDQKEQNDRIFMYIHYIGPHAEYSPTPKFREMFVETEHEIVDTRGKHQAEYLGMNLSAQQLGYIIAQYDGEIAFIDDQIGRIINKLDDRKLMNRTILIITADHGEEFFDHEEMFGHGWHPYDTMIKVPLMIWIPTAKKPQRIESQVMLIDMMPTILDLTGGIIPEGLDGTSIKPLLQGDSMNLTAYSEQIEIFNSEEELKTLSLRTDEWKYIFFVNNKTGKLFNHKSDPYEKNEVIGNENLKQKFRKELLDYYERNNMLWNDVKDNEFVEMSNETVSRLRELGYVS